jgi:tetratricopeptide (TPR) repeat protein
MMDWLLRKLFPDDRAPLPAFLLVFAVAFAMNAGVLFNGFLLDDNGQILNNKYITDIRYLPYFFSSSVYFEGADVALNYYRPIAFVVYLITHYTFGLEAWACHLVSLLLLSVNAALVLALALDLFRRCGYAECRLYAAAAALLFAVMPIHVEVASYASGISEPLLTIFSVLAFIFFVREKVVAAAAMFFVSLLCKEPALMFLPTLVVYDAFIAKPKVLRALVKRYAPFLLAIIAYFVIRRMALGRAEMQVDQDISLLQTIIAAPPLLVFYIQNALLPLDVRYFRAFNPYFSVFDFGFLASSAAVLLALAILARLCIKGRPLGLTLAPYAALPLLPAMYLPAFVLTTAAYADRYAYFSTVGLVMLLVLTMGGITSALFKHRARAAFAVIAAVFFCRYSYLTVTGVASWKSMETLFKHAYERAEGDYFMQYTIGGEYQYYGGLDRAILHLNKSIELNLSGRRVDPRTLKRAYTALSKALIDKGDIAGAIDAIDKTLAIDPTDPEANYNMGLIYGGRGMHAEAVASFEKAIKRARFYSDKADAYNNIGNILTETGRYDEAMAAYDAGLMVKPNDERLILNRAVARKRRDFSGAQPGVAPR